ncbi:MAG: SHOCT domain-containing protein [Thermoplasmata archaeon]
MTAVDGARRSRLFDLRTWHWIAFGVFVALTAMVVMLAVLADLGTAGAPTIAGGLALPVEVFLALGAVLGVTVLSMVMLYWGWPWESGGPSARAAGPVRWGRPGIDDPAVILARERFARGEITQEEYDQTLIDLARRGRGPGGPLSGS